jgi:NhaP-type Na+/H+ or K+/H+ antiporter
VSPFEASALAFGGLLIAGALAAGLAHRSFLSLTALFVVAGFALGDGVIGALHFDPHSEFVADLATVALIVILFRDGLEVEAEMLQREWRLPLRKLVLAMPITGALVALVAHALTDLSWTESFLVGALLSPTDPVLSSSVVTNPRVPRLVRHSLNLESGMNDGLALPAVLAFSAALAPGGSDFVWYEFVLKDVLIGLAAGVALGYLAAWAPVPERTKSQYALGVGFAIYGITLALPEGNAFIAVFVGAITLGIRRADLVRAFAAQAQDIVEIVKLGIFVVFGALLTVDGLFGDGWAAAGIVAFTLLVARPVAIWAALAGTRLDAATKAFMAWFGPKGVATMAFSIFVLGQGVAQGERIFDLAALAVFCSIIAHGVTDTPGSEWIATRRGEPETRAYAP